MDMKKKATEADLKQFSDGSAYLNRELSLLEFNRRVLAQAEDPTVPLLERLRFLCIVSSNLDEFFEIRVARLRSSRLREPLSFASPLPPVPQEVHVIMMPPDQSQKQKQLETQMLGDPSMHPHRESGALQSSAD